MFFETNIERPTWRLDVQKWDQMYPAIKARFEKLNEALSLAGIPGEQFSIGAKILFDQGLLESMTPQEVADVAKMLSAKSSWVPRIEWAGAETVVDAQFVTEEEWQLFRLLGGSDSAAVKNLSPFRGKQDVYHDKVGTKLLKPQDPGREFIFDYGHQVEDVVIREFCRRTGGVRIPETRMFRHRYFHEITANVDGIIRMPSGDLAVFEAKTASIHKKPSWEDGIPPYYATQCNQYMSVLDDPRIVGTYIGCVFSNNPNDCIFWFLPRNTEVEAKQLDELDSFWYENVLEGKEPPPSGHVAIDQSMLDRKSHIDATRSVRIDVDNLCEEWLTLEDERKELSQQLRKIEADRDAIAVQIQAQMGDASIGLSGSYTIERKERRPKTSINAQKLRLCFPEAYRECKHVDEPKRTFKIK